MSIEIGYLGKGQCLASAKVRRRVDEQWLNLRNNLLDELGGRLIGLGRCLGKDGLDMLAVGFANKRIDKKGDARALPFPCEYSCNILPRRDQS